jgi:NADH-quinone oxidoreductase subunit H
VTIAQPSLLLVSLIKVVVLLFLVLTAVAYLVWFERKVAAHLQGRWGPYRTGPHGLLQPLADGLKFLLKEDVTPSGADRFLFIVAPFLTMTLAISSIAIIPFGPAAIHIFGELTPLVVANVNVGLLILFAITSIGVYGVALSGWSSNSKYSLRSWAFSAISFPPWRKPTARPSTWRKRNRSSWPGTIRSIPVSNSPCSIWLSMPA